MTSHQGKGFTLIELIIVIGILVVLAAVVVVVLNPAELLKQARDSRRISDLNSIKSAIGFYLANASAPSFVAGGPFSTANATCSFTTCTVPSSGITSVAGTGWVGVDLTSLPAGLKSPLAAYPLDPSNAGTGVGAVNLQYAWKGDTSTLVFKLTAAMESAKFTTSPNDVRANDGGTLGTYYETGSDLSL